ncbi:vacuolar segregation subunit 7-domain-containing protein [Protomyces lactucae-debilis]|uniref:Vacuolar segregation subunit 7-domain-containing protein n=1 Tax=Protomyces lactucae-debilis TaxID=2754530 RepID=A0A1Y2FNP7_PROLT|nr:vacuolar segregation subunit 7-domain-containing protein [Protomyces lactucae-debilis]ORY84345.1 vacuolar segregation subunit 7-domain-containing protein [Protomyces lactucae-debilis]
MVTDTSRLIVPTLRMQPPSPIEEEDGSPASTLSALPTNVTAELSESPASNASAPTRGATARVMAKPSTESTDGALRPGTATSSGLLTESDSETGGYASSLLSAHRRVPPAVSTTLASAEGPTARPPQPGRLSVFSRRAASRSINEEPKRTMTIETETVANMSTLKAEHSSRSLRSRASTDTVRPSAKPPKKKKSRLAVAGDRANTPMGQAAQHVPTKSEIFAATITQAVDENEDSDSDETFVYESNPRSPKRLSRSPSLTSLHGTSAHSHAVGPSSLAPGLAVGSGSSSGGGVGVPSQHHAETGHRIASLSRDLRHASRRGHAISGKRSMKFAHPQDEDRRVSYTLRGYPGSATPGQDTTSPFRSPRLRPGLERKGSSPHSSGHNSPRQLSRPASPYGTSGAKKARGPKQFNAWSLYEDEENGVGSERTPFLRRGESQSGMHTAYGTTQGHHRNKSASLFAGVPFLMAIVCLMLVVLMLGAAVLSTTQPLRNVKVLDLSHVLVSKQELIFDVVVQAINPNALAVQVNEVEISVFAESPYVRDVPLPSWWHTGSGEDSTTLLLGRVYEFDAALLFESRFYNGSVSTPHGALRLEKPGNSTDDGDGHLVWERVIQHPFQLIVRGVLRYRSSWLSHLTRTVEISKSVRVNPAKHGMEEDAS